MQAYAPHALCLLLPEMSRAEFDDLRADIKRNGLNHPVTLYQGQILDGRHRYRACQELGIEARFVEFNGADPAAFVWSENGTRRNLSASQRALVAAAFMDYERGEAKMRKAHGATAPGKTLLANLPEASNGTAREKAGERLGVSGRCVADAERILKNAVPELIHRIRSGDMTINEANPISKLNPAAQKRIAAIDDKQGRRRETFSANARSESCKRRDSKDKPVVIQPGTPFLRIWLNAMERTAIIAAEHGLRTSEQIVEQFNADMDWESEPLAAQFERCVEVIEAMHKIHLRHPKSAKPKLKVV